MKNVTITVTKEEAAAIRVALAFFAACHEKSDPQTAEAYNALFHKVHAQTV